MKNPKLMTADRIPEALSNLCYHGGSSVMDLTDTIEDSKTLIELLKNIESLKLLKRFTFDRETDLYIRLKAVDSFGNVSYLIVYK